MSCSPAEAEMGFTAKLGLVDSNPASPPAAPTQGMEFTSDTVRLSVIRTDPSETSGIRGTRSLSATRALDRMRMVTGTITATPTARDIGSWLTYATGGTPSGSDPATYTLAEGLPCFDVFATRGSWTFKYRECKVSRLTLSSSQGQPLTLSADVFGRDRDDPPDTAFTWPSGLLPNPDLVDVPFMFWGAVMTVAGGASVRFREVSLSIDNVLVQDRFMNSLTPTDVPSESRRVIVSLGEPWGTNKTHLATFKAGPAAVVLTFNGPNPATKSLAITLPLCVALNLDDPTVPGRTEIMFPLNLMALAGAANSELTAVLNFPP